ncbi:MAG: DUF4338 domain-containing protein, partial [Candidatus Thiodiazotropha sp. (ex Lucinoma aequizonata)]|nr:DUF4338 domain-containing protein [Candidatus Thiodiazotropha sp. (ex Lucinoma aequizonata)]
ITIPIYTRQIPRSEVKSRPSNYRTRDRLQHSSLEVTPVYPSQERTFQHLMQAHHYLGALPKIGNTLWYIATVEDQWLALLSFSVSALKYSARDQWIGWGYRHQYGRLNLVANNSRFLILPGCHHRNPASQILSQCKRRIQQDKRVFDLVKDFGTSQSTKIDSIFDSLFCPDRPAYVTIPYCTSTASCSCTTPS